MRNKNSKSLSIFLSAHLGFFQKKLLITMYLLQKMGKGVFIDDLLYKRAVLRKEGSTLESRRNEMIRFCMSIRRLVRRRFVAVPHRSRQGRYLLITLTDYGKRTVENMLIKLKKGFGKQLVIKYIQDMFDLIDALADAYDTRIFAERGYSEAGDFPDSYEVKIPAHEQHKPVNIPLSEFRLSLRRTALYRFPSLEEMDAYWTDQKLSYLLQELNVYTSAQEKLISISSSQISRLKDMTITELIGHHKLISHMKVS